MKYPAKQFEILVESMKVLAVHLDLKAMNPHTIHYMVYQQYSEGQKHNWIYCMPGGNIQRAFKIDNLEGCEKWLTKNNGVEFELYPAGCNDDHIATAMKAALKELFTVDKPVTV